jgi:uncharacterized glyoxalase superfamily protein PhnB
MADNLDALRQPIVPVDPRPEFTADLRRTMLRELGILPPDGGATMTNATTTTATGHVHSLMAYITVSPAADAIEFYARAFGAEEIMRVEGDGRVGHAEIQIGAVRIMLSDEYPELGVKSPVTLTGSPVGLYLEVDNCDAVFERATAAGATSLRPPEDQPHGNRTATISDPFGHRWMISQPIEDISLAEYRDRSVDDGWEVSGRSDAMGTPETRVPELGYFTLSTPDVARAAAFYGALFGWQIPNVGPGAGGGDAVYGHVENTQLPFGFVDDMTMPSPQHYYRVDDIGAMVERVRELGGEVLEVSEYASGGNARCRDDQGVEFQLWQPAPGY